MRIFLGDNSRKAMEALNIKSFPFTEAELKSKFRKLIHQHHEDKGEDKRKSQQIIAAYNHLKNLASNNTSADDNRIKHPYKSRQKEKEPFNPVIPKSAAMKGTK